MAVKTIHGIGGGVTLPTGLHLKVDGWSATYSNPSVDDTGFSDGGFLSRSSAGSVSMDGTFTGTGEFDASAKAPIPDAAADGSAMALHDLDTAFKATLVLTATTGCTFTFTALVTSIAFDRPNVGKLSITVTFESAGPITQVWDESP
jgi:hypothetical protein